MMMELLEPAHAGKKRRDKAHLIVHQSMVIMIPDFAYSQCEFGK
jgi:hypothetical protein